MTEQDGDRLPLPTRCAPDVEDGRRERLIEAARAAFMEEGYHATTMDEIARRAGMSKKTIYQLFSSKEDLFGALLFERSDSLVIPIEGDGRPPAEFLSAILLKVAEFVLSPERVALARLAIAEAGRTPELAQALELRGLGRGQGSLERWLAAQTRKGILKVENPECVAKLLLSMIMGDTHFSLLLKTREPPPREELQQRLDYTIRMFMREFGVERGC